MSTWKPGDVAMVPTGRIAVADGSGNLVYGAGRHDYARPGSINSIHARPLVVIDPESVGDLARLLDLVGKHGVTRTALREYANPTPRIEEPIGLGAVVEDERGRRFVRQWTIPDPDGQAWRQENGHGLIAWCDFDPVRVLSHGVTPEEAS